MTQIAALLRKPVAHEAEVTKVKRMRKVVINTCFGGFGLTHEAIVRYAQIKGFVLVVQKTDSSLVPYKYYKGSVEPDNFFSEYDIKRDDKALVKVVEEMGNAANGWAADLKIVEIPADVKWYVVEYDGSEHIAEEHRTWR